MNLLERNSGGKDTYEGPGPTLDSPRVQMPRGRGGALGGSLDGALRGLGRVSDLQGTEETPKHACQPRYFTKPWTTPVPWGL